MSFRLACLAMLVIPSLLLVLSNLAFELIKNEVYASLDLGPGISADQVFSFADLSTPVNSITVTDAATPVIKIGTDIRIRIPSSLNLTWDTSIASSTLGGSADFRVSSTVSYEDAGKTLVLDVTSDFVFGDYLIVSGVNFNNFLAPAAIDYLELLIDGGTLVADTDERPTILHGTTISSAARHPTK